MIILIATLLTAVVAQESLSPPYFDIGKGKNISATATCGEKFTPPPGAPGELFCTLAELHGKFGIKGLSCSYCVPGDYGNDANGEDSKDHNIRNANDGSNRWWQSPPLSRGLQYREVNITIDLGQSFHVAYVIIKSANSPRPGIWALERSNDDGKTFLPWHYFAPSSAECRQYFGVDSYLPIVRDDTVICSTEYSQIPPFQDGEIHLSLINGRPGASNFSYSKTLQSWTSATNIRLRFLDIKTLLTDLLPLSLEDPTVTRRYYYSIKDISIGGRCMCNGFADECQPGNIIGKYSCRCQYNTAGGRCSRCKSGFVQHKWRPRGAGNKNFQCERCNCHGHTDDCDYDEQVEQKKLSLDIHGRHNGGGVCRNCLHNTHGINCEKCKPFFYRPKGRRITDENACQPCNCDTRFSTGLCAVETGQCECKANYAGRYCNHCNKGYHSFASCLPCECNINGSIEGECGRDRDVGCKCRRGFAGSTCDECRPGFYGFPNCTACECLTRFGALDNNCERDKGQCRCKRGYSGRECERCGRGYYQFPYCKDCGCDPRTTKGEICEAGTGACICKANFDGDRCDRCAPGYYGHPSCFACDCSTAGSESAVCHVRYGRCQCKPNYVSPKCDRCAPGYYGYPTCARCNCNQVGSRSVNCDSQTGQCSCFSIYSGRSCDRCLPGFYGFPTCERCNCNPAGTVTVGGRPGDCSTNNNGQCVCKEHVRGLECNECKSGYFTLRESNIDGCEDCRCNQAGTNSGILSCKVSGQCSCKSNVEGTRCKECKDGFYSFAQNNIFGCEGCNCDTGGAMDSTCSKSSGQCRCYPNLTGRRCNRLKPKFYFRDLHHIKVEMEEGFTPDGDAVRFDYQESKFPGYTWKGFVFINEKQPVAIVGIDVPGACSRSGAAYYEILFRYVMNQIQAVAGKVTVFRAGENTQQGVVNFVSTQKGNSVSSSYEKVINPNGGRLFFKLIPGKWNIKIEVPDSRLLLDHLVLLPREYTEAVYLSKHVNNACEVKTDEAFCNLYQYISLKKFQTIEAETPRRSRATTKVHLFNDTSVLDKLDFKSMVLLSPQYKQQDIMFKANKPGKYVAILPYYHDSDETKFIDIFVRSREDSQRGKAWLYTCRYTFGCRQAVLERQSRDVAVFNIKNSNVHLLSLISRNDATVAVDSIILIPYEEWNLDYATPKHYCVTKYGKCTLADYLIPRDAKVFRPEAKENEERPSYLIDPNVKVKYLRVGTNVLKVKDIKAGNYHLIVHYYQPNHPSFQIGVGVYSGAGSGLPGKLNLAYCPKLSGCRQQFKRSIKNSAFVFEDGTSKLRFDIGRGKDAWIEYVLFIPEGSPYMNPDLFRTLPMGLSKTFVKQCAGKDFNIRQDASKFCKESVSSLTTGCNKGAAACSCNLKGSIHSQCKEFGGQCPCRLNVIGRTCTRCKIGFYGFPNCKACNCSNCDDLTGRCTCAPGVTGEKCDKCKLGTFGYDPVIGCQPCNCDRVGTGSVNAVCNIIGGQCPCLESFGSRKCSICAPGYYDYPRCLKCTCYAPGLTADKCDSYTGRCFCQDNVVGTRCSDCPSGYFKTRAFKPKTLCHKCWCNGRATSCQEAKLFRNSVRSPNGIWKMSTEQISPTAIIVNTFSRREFGYTVGARYHRVNLNDYNAKSKSEVPQIMYWVAPKEFLGNQMKSYGGQLTYDFVYSVKKGFVSQPLNGIADVIIHSDGLTLHSTKRFSRSPGKAYKMSVLLTEAGWTNDGVSHVTRNLFLSALSNIKSIHIRATHDENTAISTLTNVVMGSGGEIGNTRVFGIEKCNCRWGYTGLSCSLCAAGYTRQKDGTCGKCQCSGKSRTCDPEDGKCTNCTGNTDGEQCEKCQRGFYGDKCKPCECPSADPINNFADSCSIAITTGSLVCKCKAGYAGRRCEKCADGYYGEPEKRGGSCNKCLCSGNVDTKLTGNCDQKTGQCYKCVKNTFGPQCEKCRPGYYGDAVVKKNCEDCKCNLCGSLAKPCDRLSGQCQCKKNVIGARCNKCKPNTWNYRACKGCEDCGCGTASESKTCNTETGQCKCKPTVIGKQCDWCKFGYYGYSGAGCSKCNCPNGGYCDVKTGSCDCGVLGEKCTLCPMGHIIENGQCVECDSCVQNTLKRVNVLITNITIFKEVVLPVGSVSLASLDEVKKTLMRLTKDSNKFESELENLREKIGYGKYGQVVCKVQKISPILLTKTTDSKIIPKGPTITAVVIPITTPDVIMVTDLPTETPTTELIGDTTSTSTDFLESFTTTDVPETATARVPLPLRSSSLQRSKREVPGEIQCPASKTLRNTNTKFEKSKEQVSKLEKDAYEAKAKSKTTKRRAKDTWDRLRRFGKKLDTILNFANSSLGGLDGDDVDEKGSLKKALEILKELKERDFTSVMKGSNKEKESAGNATMIADRLKKKADEIEAKVGKKSFKDLLEAFRNLKKSSRLTKANADNVVIVVSMAKSIDYKSIIDMAKKIDKRSRITLEEAKEILKESEDALKMGRDHFEVFNNKKVPLADLIERLRKYVKDLLDQLQMARPKVDESVKHAKNLTVLSDRLKGELQDTKVFANTSLRAAYVYSVIVDAIYEALRAARMANDTAHEAKEKASAAKTEAIDSKAESAVIRDKAKAMDDVKDKLRLSLESVKKKIMDLKKLREKIQGRVEVVKDDIKGFEKEKLIGEVAKNVSVGAVEATGVAEDGTKLARKIKELVKEDNKVVVKLTDQIGDINKDIKAAAEKVKNVTKQIPPLEETIDIINRKHSDIQIILDNNVTNSIKYIQFLVANARSLVDHVKLAMNFSSKTQVLVLDAPKAAYDPTINTRISIIFKHFDGGDALLLFMGNGSDPDGDGNGYLGFDINKNKVRFHFKANAGSGDELSIPDVIARDKWYKITATRNFKRYSLRMVEIDIVNGEINPVEESTANLVELPILTLGKDSDVFLGSIPPGKKRPNAFAVKPLAGCLDRLIYDDEVMGLWDWKEAKDVNGCKRKGRMKDTGDYCFNGEGFVDFKTVNYRYTKVKLAFRTLEKDGLLILALDPPTAQKPSAAYFALEINNGILVSKYNFGGGFNKIVHSEYGQLNNGKIHSVLVRVRKGKVVFKINGIKRKGVVNINDDDIRYAAKKVYVGGVPMNEYYPDEVNTKGYTGCVSKIELKDTGGVLTSIDNAFNYIQPRETLANYSMIGQSASFPKGESYLEVPACSLVVKDKVSSFGFTFQTFFMNGTLIMAPNLRITLKDGQVNLVVVLDGTPKIIKSKNPTSLADGKWHTVSLVNQFGTNLLLGTDRTLVSFQSDALNSAFEFSGNKNMNIGGGVGLMGFNGNIREVYCSANKINLAAGSLRNGTKVGSVKREPPLNLVVPPTVPATTKAPVTTPATMEPTMKKTTMSPSTPKKQTTMPSTQPPVTTQPPVITQLPVITEIVTTQPPPIATLPPVVTTESPQVTTQQPTFTTQSPDITQPPPVTTQLPPVTTTSSPVIIQPPSVTTQSIPVTTQLPETTQAPAVTIKQPTVTTQTPLIITQLPAVTTESPAVTTQISIVTTQPPPVTTQPPPVVTQPPPVNTQPPPVTTQPPPVTTQPPPVTTQPPPVTTQPPSVTTQPPPVTTQPPLVIQPPLMTTLSPSVTTQPAVSIPPVTTPEPVITPLPVTTLLPVTTKQPVTSQPPITVSTTISAPAESKLIATTRETCKKGVQVNHDAYGFGLSSESYTEFSIKKRSLDKQSQYEFYFYTLEPNGILLSANMVKFDYESIFLTGGKVAYTFNAGSGGLLLTTTKKYNDGKWHKVVTRRLKTQGVLNVDEENAKVGNSKGPATSVNSIETLYVGGFPRNALVAKRISRASKAPLKGGIRNIKSSGEALVPAVKKGVSEAYIDGLNYVDGAYFGKNGGYVSKSIPGEVGRKYKITLDVRSRNKAGYIFYVAGRRDGINLLILSNGNIKAECNNGGGLFSVEVTPPTSICDGEFHSILLVKQDRTLTLTVDGVSNTVTTKLSGNSANTGKAPVYFGGIPANVRPRDYQVFSGCITAIKIKGKPVDFSIGSRIGGGAMRGCGG